MDVRCEKCGTEYELDENRLKPGGVTVKCTTCGHMFKIRKRAPTNVGVASPVPVSNRSARADAVPRPQTQTGAGSGPNDRNWIIRLINGETRTCQELATLQQWIISGEVTRDSMISRSGKTWKQLGDIPELAQFFGIAEEARERTRRESARVTSPQQPQRAASSTPDPKATVLGVPAAPLANRRPPTKPPPPPGSPLLAATRPANDALTPQLPQLPRAKLNTPVAAPPAPPPAPTVLAVPPRVSAAGPAVSAAVAPPPPPPAAARPASTGGLATATPPTTASPTGPAPARPIPPPAERKTGGWAAEEIKQVEPADDGAFGGKVPKVETRGFGGAIKPVPTHDVAFASSINRAAGISIPPPSQSAEVDRVVFDEETGPILPHRRGGGAGKWIAIASLGVIAGAAIAFYMIVIRQPSSARSEKNPAANPPALDAATTVAETTVDAAAPVAVVPDEGPGLDVLLGDDETALTEARTALAEDPARQDPPRLALRARIATALAQQLLDRAQLTTAKADADKLRKQAAQLVAEALPLAEKAVKKAPDLVLAQVAMADVRRLDKSPPREVKARVDAALRLAPDDREVQLVAAMANPDAAAARAALDKLDSGDGALEVSGDVRPRWRRALAAHAAGDTENAQLHAEAVIAATPGHEGARLLLARLRDTVASTDPMPVEEDDPPDNGQTPDPKPPDPKQPDPKEPEGNYDQLLAKADKLAEGGNCNAADDYYAKALAIKPNGVGALTGRGYCYLDKAEFKSAHSSFRAALAVSSKYEPALWGVAETYQQQGNKAKAIEAYEAYLAVYPNSAKAKKQIERLGGSTEPKPEEPKPEEPKPQGGNETDPKPEEPRPEEPKPEEPKPEEGNSGGGESGSPSE
jgi:predicted Zn finger-like uncharacterized protein